MSAPLRPVAVRAQPSTGTPPTPLGMSTGDASSTSSSVTTSTTAQGGPVQGVGGRSQHALQSSQITRSDQVMWRFYLKTLSVLGEARLTHYGHASGKGERKVDKWFNLNTPEADVDKADLQMYRYLSAYSYPRPHHPLANNGIIPPLLVAFVLDTSDIHHRQALMWNRDCGKVTIDTNLLSKGSKNGDDEKEQNMGIVLERWTLRAVPVPRDENLTASQMAPHTAYRLGIVHFRALFALVRLLPTYRLYRRLRRANNGLRLGIKLWAPEGYQDTAEDLAAAWAVMEQGLVSLDQGLEDFCDGQMPRSADKENYELPPVDMFGTSYSATVEFRPEIDLTVEDIESVLSEKFVDMDEDWFKPTVHRAEDDPSKSASKPPSRRVSNPTSIPTTSPIPPRQQAAAPGSFGSLGRPVGTRAPSNTGGTARASAGSQGSGRWGVLAEGMPFARPASIGDTKPPPSPTSGSYGGNAVTARRLSGHSAYNPSSPSGSLLRSTPPTGVPTPVGAFRPGSSVGRTSSFLSQSGRSFTHAQMANMPPAGTSPPVHSPTSPSSGSLGHPAVARSISGRGYNVPQSSSPIIPGSFERDGHSIVQPGSSVGASGAPVIKRYSSSLSRRPGAPFAGSYSSSAENAASAMVLASGAYPNAGLLRRTSTRTSQESALRYSATPGVEDDDLQAFLKSMEALPQPPSMAAIAAHNSRSHLPSMSSSLSNNSVQQSGQSGRPASSPRDEIQASPGQQPLPLVTRTPMTRLQVDDELKRMAGSFNLNTNKLVESITKHESSREGQEPSPVATVASASPRAGTSLGLLSASRPATSPRRSISGESPPRPLLRRQGSIKTTSSPLAGSPSHFAPAASPTGRPLPVRPPTARSLPGPAPAFIPGESAGSHMSPSGLSPQTTGTSTATNESRASGRRTVLLRGGFERGVKPSTGSSPSHSPIRDFGRLSLGPKDRGTSLGSRAESLSAGPGGMGAGGSGFGRLSRRGTASSVGTGGILAQRTAPSSFGGAEIDYRVTGGEDISGEEAIGEEGEREIRRRSGDGGVKRTPLSGDW